MQKKNKESEMAVKYPTKDGGWIKRGRDGVQFANVTKTKNGIKIITRNYRHKKKR